jgi:hypothetical protein
MGNSSQGAKKGWETRKQNSWRTGPPDEEVVEVRHVPHTPEVERQGLLDEPEPDLRPTVASLIFWGVFAAVIAFVSIGIIWVAVFGT